MSEPNRDDQPADDRLRGIADDEDEEFETSEDLDDDDEDEADDEEGTF